MAAFVNLLLKKAKQYMFEKMLRGSSNGLMAITATNERGRQLRLK